MTKTKAPDAALTTTTPAAHAVTTTAPVDELAGYEAEAGREIEDDGLGTIDPEDIRIATKVFNFKGVGRDGRKVPEDAFYDTIDETVADVLHAAFVLRHKTRSYSWYDTKESRRVTECRSQDRVTGTMRDGTKRPCEGCPDFEWRSGPDGKRRKNCDEITNMFAVDLATQMPFVIRFKRTSAPVITSYLQRYHFKRRVVRGQRVNYPLYAFAVELRCRMSDDGKYALPVLTRGAVLPPEQVAQLELSAMSLRDIIAPVMAHVDAQATRVDGADGGGDASFNPDQFVDAPAGGGGGGDGFVS